MRQDKNDKITKKGPTPAVGKKPNGKSKFNSFLPGSACKPAVKGYAAAGLVCRMKNKLSIRQRLESAVLILLLTGLASRSLGQTNADP
jgi:hypothetical protein